MTKHVYQQSVFAENQGVQIAPYAAIVVTNASDDSAASIWEDEAGATPITGGELLADENGFFRFYADAGTYNIQITSGSITETLTDVEIGIPAVPVLSVNGQTGDVFLDAADVGADPAGTAAASITALKAETDPFPQYTTDAEAGAIADASAAASVTALKAETDPFPQYTTDAEAGVIAANAAAALHAVSYDAQSPSDAQKMQAQRNLGTQVFIGTAFPTGEVAPAVLIQMTSGGQFSDILIMETTPTLWDSGNSSINGALSDDARTATFTTGAIVSQTARTVGKSSGKVNCGIVLDTGPSSSDSLLALYWKNNAGEYAGVYFRMDVNNTTTGIGGLSDWLLNLAGGNDGMTGHLAGLLVGQPVRVLVDIATGVWSVQTGSYSVNGNTTLTHNSPGWFEIQMYHYPSGTPVLTGVVEVLASDYGDYVAIGT